MKVNIALLVVLASLLAGCATSKTGLYSYRDRLNNEVTDMITDNLLPTDGTPGALVWLNASRINKANGAILYFLEVHYVSPNGWLEIDPGNSLILKLDDKENQYNGSGSINMRTKDKNGQFVEDAIYRVTAADIRQIANAKQVKVTVIGSKGAVTRNFAPANAEKFKSFVSKYLDRRG